MNDNIQPKNPSQGSPFDSIRQMDDQGGEYWSARDLQILLKYANWQNFEKVIKKAMASCRNVEQNPSDHFIDVNKIVEAGATSKPIKDYRLTRYGCYLTAMNGDSEKQEIAQAQNYFAVKTRQAETANNNPSVKALYDQLLTLQAQLLQSEAKRLAEAQYQVNGRREAVPFAYKHIEDVDRIVIGQNISRLARAIKEILDMAERARKLKAREVTTKQLDEFTAPWKRITSLLDDVEEKLAINNDLTEQTMPYIFLENEVVAELKEAESTAKQLLLSLSNESQLG